MRSNVNVAKHPLHPMLVLLPAGAWITSFVLDIIFLASGNTFWFIASMWVIVVGIAGALVAAAAGVYDLFTLPMSNEPRSVGISHMTLNLVITVLYLINVLAVRVPVLLSPIRSLAVIPGSTAAWAFILNLVAIGLLAVSGWLGGELVYRYGIAVPDETIENAHNYEAAPLGRRTAYSGALGGARHEEEEKKHKDKDIRG